MVGTGHTPSDRAETMLLYLIRGSESAGLYSLREKAKADLYSLAEAPLTDAPQAWKGETICSYQKMLCHGSIQIRPIQILHITAMMSSSFATGLKRPSHD